ncbi:MAG: ABC transporter ATP-binding protein [Coriobacteriia bacterium]
MAERAPLLVADTLEKVYGSGEIATRALKGVSFTLEAGEFASIVGQSGSGKSTLLNLLGLLDTPTSGVVRYNGVDTGALKPSGRAGLRNGLIGFVFQFHYLLPEFTVWENMVMPRLIAGTPVGDAERGRGEELLDLLGLAGLADKNANQLSGGQKQRVAIGRALMNEPELILADEPTGNLDSSNSEAVYELFRRINAERGTTFLVVTHDRRIAQQTDRILEVLDGELVQDVPNDYRSSLARDSAVFRS